MANSQDNRILVSIRKPYERKATRYLCEPTQVIPKKCIVLARFNDSPSLYKVLKEKQLNINDWSPSKAYHLHEDSEAKQVYMQGLQDIISALKADGGKTVISRRLHTRTSADADEIFRHLCCLYPASAIYLWPDGESYWIGATPELLLNVDNNTVSSVSLAGTRPAGSAGEWDDKNLKEQQMVTDFILGMFRQNGFQPSWQGPKTREAGPVEHLCTEISAKYFAEINHLLNFACRLAPTPAVCGLPRERALAQISHTEPLPREFYGGFFGLIDGDKMQLYVTLRCLKLHPSGDVEIFAGGGITADSDPETEWKETCQKAYTLLAALPAAIEPENSSTQN